MKVADAIREAGPEAVVAALLDLLLAEGTPAAHAEGCGTGAGGFKSGNTCGKGGGEGGKSADEYRSLADDLRHRVFFADTAFPDRWQDLKQKAHRADLEDGDPATQAPALLDVARAAGRLASLVGTSPHGPAAAEGYDLREESGYFRDLGAAALRLARELRPDVRLNAEAASAAHAEEPPWLAFREAPLRPLAPEAAVRYFRAKVPTLAVDAAAFSGEQRRRAFTLAADTEGVLTERVKRLIQRYMERGVVFGAGGPLSGPGAVQLLLDAAGVTSKSGAYAKLVFDTATRDALAQGMDAERRAAGADRFPAWRWAHSHQGTPRETHLARDGRYYHGHVRFDEVRGTGPEEVCGCKCQPVPVGAAEWAKLRAGGATVEESW